jgi:hypothetical protein
LNWVNFLNKQAEKATTSYKISILNWFPQLAIQCHGAEVHFHITYNMSNFFSKLKYKTNMICKRSGSSLDIPIIGPSKLSTVRCYRFLHSAIAKEDESGEKMCVNLYTYSIPVNS